MDTVSAISIDDLRTYRARNFARDNLFIGVVGAIDQKTLAGFVDKVFGGLPLSAQLAKIPDAIIPDKPFLRTAELDVPQTVIQFGRPGLLRDDPDFIPAYVLNYILGGGSFSSRLYEEVRENARSGLFGLFLSLSARPCRPLCRRAGHARRTRAGSHRYRARRDRAYGQGRPHGRGTGKRQGLSERVYALRFDTGDKIASQLVQLQLEDLGYDYFDKRNGMIEAVKMEDIRRAEAAARQGRRSSLRSAARPSKPTDKCC
ncbi:MAG: insulinase family protein [Tepidamorphaceae bacterium]